MPRLLEILRPIQRVGGRGEALGSNGCVAPSATGEIKVAGPGLAQSLTELGLIDEYRIYLHPVVLGYGRPYFAAPAAAPPYDE